jgi:fatty acid desaturase
MTDEEEPGNRRDEDSGPGANELPPASSPRQLVRLPALVVIALYMFLLAGLNVVSVAKGLARPPYLIFSAAFFTAAAGLLLLFRWAWTLTLAAVVLLSGLFFYRFSAQHDIGSIMQGGLNLVIFFYLVRPEVRANLR